MKTTAIILAAGSSARYGQPKQFAKLAGKPVLAYSLEVYQEFSGVDEIIVVTSSNNIDKCWAISSTYGISKISKVVVGGNSRQDSSYIGLKSCENTQWVHIHDAARPFLCRNILQNIELQLKSNDSVDVCIPAYDTIVEGFNGRISGIPDRKSMYIGQTPQAFSYDLILRSHNEAIKLGDFDNTDDCSLVIKYGNSLPVIASGTPENIKITHPFDIYLAEEICRLRAQQLSDQDLNILRGKKAVVFGGRTGIGDEVVKILRFYGCHVVPVSRNTSGISADITNYSQLEDVFESIGKVDYVINTVGFLKIKKLHDMSLDEFKEVYDINLFGAFNITKHSLMALNNGGSIVHIGSSSYSRGRATYSAYSSAKSALVNFVQAVSDEFSENGIRVNLVSPDRTATAMREQNFGRESVKNLLTPQYVAHEVAKLLVTDVSGINLRLRI